MALRHCSAFKHGVQLRKYQFDSLTFIVNWLSIVAIT